MTDADKAFETAREMIAEAKRSGVEMLDFDREQTRALRRLPDEIGEMDGLHRLNLNNTDVSDLVSLAGLTGLTRLDLSSTEVSDLTPLAGLTGLTTLFLNSTDVSDIAPLAGLTGLTMLDLDRSGAKDLRPLSGLHRLANTPEGFGLTYRDCAATRLDDRIREISEIKDAATRAKTLFGYLETWEPPWEQVPEADELVSVEVVHERIELAARHPTEAERDEALKRALHERLRDRAEDLARLAGNLFPRLATRARGLHEKLSRPFETLDMMQVHLDIEDLADIYERRDSRQGEDAFTPDVVDVLADIARDGPGLTLDNPDVERLEERKRRFAASPPPEHVQAAHAEMSRKVAAAEAVFGDRLRTVEDRMEGREDLPSTGVMQEAVHRNVLLRIGRFGLGIAGTAAVGAMGSALWQFVHDGWPVFTILAESYGPAFARWFVASLSNVEELAGVLANAEIKPIPRRSKKD